MSATSSRSSARSSKSITEKPWFLTCIDGDVFAWKDDARLKLKNGQSAGRVMSVSVLNVDEGLVSVGETLPSVTTSALTFHSCRELRKTVASSTN